jgi:hypothetical protein
MRPMADGVQAAPGRRCQLDQRRLAQGDFPRDGHARGGNGGESGDPPEVEAERDRDGGDGGQRRQAGPEATARGIVEGRGRLRRAGAQRGEERHVAD